MRHARLMANCLALALLLPLSAGAADPFTLAFGSCLRQWQPQPVWDGILAVKPRVLVLGGDNVYADYGPDMLAGDPARIGKAYARLAHDAGFQRVRKAVPILATWDDHDYGANNAGAEYPYGAESKRYFLDFFAIPADAPVRTHAGVYSAHWLDDGAHRIQLILLDTRSFRSPLVAAPTTPACPRTRWGGNTDPAATVLGAAQWQWLAQRLAEPAELRLIVSSIQVLPDAHCWEKWANFPREREKLLALLASHPEAPIVLLSGDRHLGDISVLRGDGGRPPLYEVTSSGLNSAGAGVGEANAFRAVPTNVSVDNFATVTVNWDAGQPRIDLALRATDGRVLQQARVDTTR